MEGAKSRSPLTPDGASAKETNESGYQKGSFCTGGGGGGRMEPLLSKSVWMSPQKSHPRTKVWLCGHAPNLHVVMGVGGWI